MEYIVKRRIAVMLHHLEHRKYVCACSVPPPPAVPHYPSCSELVHLVL